MFLFKSQAPYEGKVGVLHQHFQVTILKRIILYASDYQLSVVDGTKNGHECNIICLIGCNFKIY